MKTLCKILTCILMLMPMAPCKSAEISRQVKIAQAQKSTIDELSQYRRSLQGRIEGKWLPPRGYEGERVVVSCKLFDDGHVSDLRLDRPSRVPIANEAAVRALTTAQPFRQLPPDSVSPVTVALTFDYNLFGREPRATFLSGPQVQPSLDQYAKAARTQVAANFRLQDYVQTKALARVSAWIDRSGRCSNVRLTSSSHVDELDYAGIQAVRSVQSYGQLPTGGSGSVTIEFTFSTNLCALDYCGWN